MTLKKLSVILSLIFAQYAIASDINNNSKKLSEISHQIATAQVHLKQTINQQNKLQAQLEQSEQSIGTLSNNIRQLNQHIDKNNNQLSNLNQQIAQYQASLEMQRAELNKQIRIAYQTNRENYLKILINQENPYELSRIMTYYQYFSRAHLQAINTINETLANIQNTHAAISQNTESLKQLLTARVTQQQNLKASREKRRIVLTELHNQVETQHQRLATLEANKHALEKLINTVRQQQAQTPYLGGKFGSLKHRLAWPTRGPITHSFGSVMNQSLRYSGVFIKAPIGQNIQAIAPGKVVFSNWLKGFGLLLIIDHGDGYMSLYAQCNSLYKKAGDTVVAGEPIASVGNSGGEEEAGLLFQIRENGTPINPNIWCK